MKILHRDATGDKLSGHEIMLLTCPIVTRVSKPVHKPTLRNSHEHNLECHCGLKEGLFLILLKILESLVNDQTKEFVNSVTRPSMALRRVDDTQRMPCSGK